MRITVLSDIHGNLPALKAALPHIEAWPSDMVIVNGDIISRGPRSRECWDVVKEKEATAVWQLLRGNHEEFVLTCEESNLIPDTPAYQVRQFAHWSYNQLTDVLDDIRPLPDKFNWVAPDGSEFRIRHGSMTSNRDGLHIEDGDEKLTQQIAPAPAVFVTAHTHRPFIHRIGQSLIVNIGSIGSPFDGQQTPSFGRFWWTAQQGWQAEIVRFWYDVTKIEQDYVSTGFLQEGGALTQLMLVELRKARGLMFRWGSRHYENVIAGTISIEESVIDILKDEDVRPFTGSPGWQIN